MATFRAAWWQKAYFTGTDASDDMFGAGFADTIHGGGGADTIHGGGGDDHIYGDDGDDKLFGDEGDDKLFGGNDNDTLDGGKGNDTLFGGADQDLFVDIYGNNTIDGQTGTDTVDYSAFLVGHVKVTLADTGSQGTAIREDLIFSVDRSSHYEEDSRDTLVSIENVVGTSGNDVIIGNSEANVLSGGKGVDVLTGGGGADTFRFRDGDLSNQVERITDFDSFDRIDLSSINVSGNNVLHFVDNFSGTSGEMLLRHFEGNVNLFVDTDGNGSTDYFLQIHETVAGNLTANDFIL